MNNPFMSAPQMNPLQLAQDFRQFAMGFKGDPKAEVQKLLDSGKITPEQALHHPRRNIITRVIGGERFVRSDTFESEAAGGDIFILCSDGLINALELAEIGRLCQEQDEPQAICSALIDEALKRGARDNVTVAVVIYEKGSGEDEQ